MQNPTVSIIIPCYNAGVHLAESIHSVRSQTYTDWELIIVDDGSTDPHTLEVINSLQCDPSLRIISQANAGPAAARNTAIQAAKGKYILPLDADDTIEPTYIEKGVALLEQNKNLGIVYCKAKKFGCEEGPWPLPPFSIEEMVLGNVIFCTAFFRRDDWEDVGGYPEELRHGLEDYAFWLKLLHIKREVYQIDEYLFNYRIKKCSRTTEFVKNRENYIKTHAEIFRINQDFFADNIEALYKYYFSIQDRVRYYDTVFDKGIFVFIIKKITEPCPLLFNFIKKIYTIYKTGRGIITTSQNKPPRQ